MQIELLLVYIFIIYLEIEFHLADFRTVSWSDATVVFANSTCFSNELYNAMVATSSQMRPGTFFITFTKALSSPDWKLMESEKYNMSWGEATVFIHMKVH